MYVFEIKKFKSEVRGLVESLESVVSERSQAAPYR